MGRISVDLNSGGGKSGSGPERSHSDSGNGSDGLAGRILERLKEIGRMAEWIKVGLPVFAAILSAYVMIQGHDIKITRLESDMSEHIDDHKKEAKEAYDKLSRISAAIERIETKVEMIKGH